jgi:quinoprotein glucose dehydrogenase
VPTSDVPGEALSPTQPFPTLPKPLVPSQLTEDQIWAITPKEREFVRSKVKGMRNEGIFTPPSLQGTVLFPGNVGGCNWSGGSFDPQSQTLYVNTNRIATLITLIPKESFPEVKQANPGVEITAQFGAPFGVRRDWLFGHGRVPGNKPPWGTLTAVDLNSGQARWEVPLGSMPSLADLPGSERYGSINFGGSMVTESGLVFIAASLDAHLRAFSAKTGEVLWSAALPTGGHGAPMTFRSKKTGKQYIVQIAGGHHGIGTRNGDSILAYALP